MQALKIVALCVASAALYGITHDQVTARVCVEYFTIFHPPIFETDSPTVLAFGWGVLATWWCGLFLGIPLAMIARLGSRPRLGPGDLVKPIGVVLLVMAAISFLAGVAGLIAAKAGWVWLLGPLASEIPGPKHAAFLADLWAHTAAYAVGLLGGIAVLIRTWRRRTRLAHPDPSGGRTPVVQASSISVSRTTDS